MEVERLISVFTLWAALAALAALATGADSVQAAHPSLIIDGGLRVAPSSFHTYDHNLISEIQILL